MKVKAGILTLHQADNYGAVLQAYALQQVLTGLGAQSELITTDFPELSLRTVKNPLPGASSRSAEAPPSGTFSRAAETPPSDTFSRAADTLPSDTFSRAAETPPSDTFSRAAETPPSGTFSRAAETPPSGTFSRAADTDFSGTALRKSGLPPSGAASRTAAALQRRVEQAQEERSRLFSRFRQNYLHCSEIYLRSELAIANHDYDVFIAGSDQVWNLRLFGAHESYFLTFADSRKKTSYAASFGSAELSSKARKWCAEMLGDFALLSVRERSAQKLVEEMTGRTARVCLDPVLLLSRSEWDRLIFSSSGLLEPAIPSNPVFPPNTASASVIAVPPNMKILSTSTALSNPAAPSDTASSSDKKVPSNPAAPAEKESPYYLLYLLQYDQNLADRARKTAREAGADLKVVTGTFLPQFGFQAYNRTGVLEWIRLIAHAEGIFTDSFHGTVFSLLYDKPFLTSLPAEAGEHEGRGSRIAELLRSIGLSVEQGDRLTTLPPGLTWKQLDSARESSLQYLREIITYARTAKSGKNGI